MASRVGFSIYLSLPSFQSRLFRGCNRKQSAVSLQETQISKEMFSSAWAPLLSCHWPTCRISFRSIGDPNFLTSSFSGSPCSYGTRWRWRTASGSTWISMLRAMECLGDQGHGQRLLLVRDRRTARYKAKANLGGASWDSAALRTRSVGLSSGIFLVVVGWKLFAVEHVTILGMNPQMIKFRKQAHLQ